MNLYLDYLTEIKSRETQGLAPKPIDDGALTGEIIALIRDAGSEHRTDALKFFIYNTLPGTTSAAGVKAAFLKQIVLGEAIVPEITPKFALELLSHMKGGPSVVGLLDIALGDNAEIAEQAGDVLKTQVFLYDADMFRLRDAYKAGNPVAKSVLESYSKAEFFTKLPDVDDEIKVVTFIAAEGDISTDLLSPGNQAHSRSDRELHGQCMITPEAQAEIVALQKQHPASEEEEASGQDWSMDTFAPALIAAASLDGMPTEYARKCLDTWAPGDARDLWQAAWSIQHQKRTDLGKG